MRGGRSTRNLKTITAEVNAVPGSPNAGARPRKPESATDTIRGHERKSDRVKDAVEAKGVVDRAKKNQILETAIPSGSKVVKGFDRRGVNGSLAPK